MTRTLVILALLASSARAEPTVVDKAGALFEKAQAHYTAGEFRAAIGLFEEAYELVHDPIYLFNLAQTYRKVLDCVNAWTYYRRYLVEAKDADQAQRAKVDIWIRELAPCVDERTREIEAARRGEEAERTRVAEQERLAREAARPRFIEIDPGRRYRIAGYAAGGAGALGLVVGIIYSRRGSSLRSELAAECADGCVWTDGLEAKDRAGGRANTIAAVSWIGSGAAIVGGAVFYVIGRTKKIERIQITPGRGSATVSARFAF